MAELDHDPAIFEPARGLRPRGRPEPHRAVAAEPHVERPAREAARTVAAVVRLAAVGVVVQHREVELRIALQQQHAVGADAAPPVTQPPHQRGTLRPGRQVSLAMIDHHEIVRGTLHFQKGDRHGVMVLRAWDPV